MACSTAIRDAENKASVIVDFLHSHDLHKAHGRHLHRNELKAKGLAIVDLEGDPALQDAVLSVHHACMLTVGNFNVAKLIENHNGIAHAKVIGTAFQVPLQAPVLFRLRRLRLHRRLLKRPRALWHLCSQKKRVASGRRNPSSPASDRIERRAPALRPFVAPMLGTGLADLIAQRPYRAVVTVHQ